MICLMFSSRSINSTCIYAECMLRRSCHTVLISYWKTAFYHVFRFTICKIDLTFKTHMVLPTFKNRTLWNQVFCNKSFFVCLFDFACFVCFFLILLVFCLFLLFLIVVCLFVFVCSFVLISIGITVDLLLEV